PALIEQNGVSPEFRLVDAYSHLAPMIDTDIYMHWLLAEVRQAGCEVLERTVTGPLGRQEESLRREYGADVIVHCTGLGARGLGDESVYPVRGALIRVHNDGRAIPRITDAHCISRNGSSEQGFIFIVPRGEDTLILGGLAEPGEWDMEIGLNNYEPIRNMYRRCVQFMPLLERATIIDAEPVRVGLRPFRRGNVRLEHESGTRIIHNYGHGGSGVTFSWGCALEVADRVEELVGAGVLA